MTNILVLFALTLSFAGGDVEATTRCGDDDGTRTARCLPPAPTAEELADKVRQLTTMVRKNVAGYPTDFHALEGNQFVVVQSPSDVFVVGDFYSPAERAEAIDVTIKAESFYFSAIQYNIDDLPSNAVEKSLRKIENSSEFPTFLKKTRYLGFARIAKDPKNAQGEIDMEKLRETYRKAAKL